MSLPPTTGPCPHCSQTITSPGPDEPAPAAVKVPVTPPSAEVGSRVPAAPAAKEEAAASTPEPAPAAVREAPVPREIPAAAAASPPSRPIPAASAATAKPRGRTLGLAAALLLLFAAAGGGLWLLSGGMRKAPEGPPLPMAGSAAGREQKELREKQYLEGGWEAEAREVLGRFLAAETPAGKAAYSIRGSELLGEMQEFYGGARIDDSDTPQSAFSVFRLTLEDRKRGIFMMSYELPPSFEMSEFFSPIVPLRVQYQLEDQGMLIEQLSRTSNFVNEPMRVHVLFKRTPDGLRVDWETFVQTKYRRMRDFIELPEPGRTAVFRVIISETVPENRTVPAGHRVYLVADPAHRGEDSLRIHVPVDTEIGRALSILNWRGTNGGRAIARTATVELRWSDEVIPQPELSRFLCWEFLGVGGEALPSGTQSDE